MSYRKKRFGAYTDGRYRSATTRPRASLTSHRYLLLRTRSLTRPRHQNDALGPGSSRRLLIQGSVTLEPTRVDGAIIQPLPYGAVGLMEMAALSETARGRQASELRKATVQLFPRYPPDSHVAEPGCIRHQTPATELDETGTHRGVSARAVLPAELASSERVLRFECVHETRLSDARRSGKRGDPLTELLGKPIHALA